MNTKSLSSAESFKYRYARFHKCLRTEGGSPSKKALAVGLGALIGCLPLYGLHLLLSIVVAHLFKLNKLLTYLVTYINNPVVLPFILSLEYVVGYRLLRSDWPEFGFSALQPENLLQTGLEIIVGSLIVGATVGLVLGIITYLATRGDTLSGLRKQLCELTTDRYLSCGFMNWEFVRGKLIYDPIYFDLLENRRLEGATRLWDMGCGRGILLSMLASAKNLSIEERGDDYGWLDSIELNGLEDRDKDSENGRIALGGDGNIVTGNVTAFTPPDADCILLIDVLLYLPEADQETVISRVSKSLSAGGQLIIREADGNAGWRYQTTKFAERLRAIFRGHFTQKYFYRSQNSWQGLLEANNFQVTTIPMSEGTPFSNILFIAIKGSENSLVDETL